MSTFLCSKLEDHYTCSVAALPGLKNILQRQPKSQQDIFIKNKSKQTFVSKETSCEIIKSILRDMHVQSMVQFDRLSVFTMCRFVLKSNLILDEIKNQKFSSDFVYGYFKFLL